MTNHILFIRFWCFYVCVCVCSASMAQTNSRTVMGKCERKNHPKCVDHAVHAHSHTHRHQLCDNVRKAGKKVRCLTEFSGKKESNSQRRKQMSVNCALKESNREIYALEEVAVFRANHFEPVVPLLIRPQPYTRAIVYNVCWLLSCTNIKRHKTAKKPFHWNFRRTIQSTPHKLYQHIFTYRSGAIYRCVCFVLLMDAHTSLQSVRFAHFLDYHQLLFCMGLCFVFSFVCVCAVYAFKLGYSIWNLCKERCAAKKRKTTRKRSIFIWNINLSGCVLWK